MTASAAQVVFGSLARAVTPRRPLTVSQWADKERKLSAKGSAEPGRWRTDRNPPLREPMDCLSARSPVRNVVCMFPIQFGKSEIETNALGYVIDHNPGPAMVCLPGEVSMNKFIAQKLTPLIDETPAVKARLTSTASRDAANRREFKDFEGGQLYIEHAGNPKRLKSTSVRFLFVDELDEFAASLVGGDDPVEMLEGRTSAFPGSYKRLFISTPQLAGTSRIEELWLKSDMRRYHVACPHCGHEQPLIWSGLHWDDGCTRAWYVCAESGCIIEEHHKTAMIAAGRWVPEHPERKSRGYTLNCLYYQLGLGPRWLEMAQKFRDCANDPARLKTFVNDRLAETWTDPSMRAVKHNAIADRAEPYRLRTAPQGVIEICAGVDTQDNRLAVQLVGFGIGMAAWTLDYLELPGDPADEAVWCSLVDLLNAPIEHASGALMRVQATAIDAGGHRTEAVKNFVRARRIRRPLCIFGAVPNNAPVISKGKLEDVTWQGRTDKRGVMIQHVGTVGIKHLLYSRLSTDAEKATESRLVRFSDELDSDYFSGLVSETYDPAKNRFVKRRGNVRNEPLDTWVYAYAAAHHAELRLHRRSRAEWLAAAARLVPPPPAGTVVSPAKPDPVTAPVTRPPASRPAGSFLRSNRDEY